MTTLADLRNRIDEIDQRLIAILAERTDCVRQIAELKKTDQDVVATDRQKLVFQTRREWAAQAGVDPDLVEELYRVMITRFIELQRQQLGIKE